MHPSFPKEEKVLENYEAVLNISLSLEADVNVRSKNVRRLKRYFLSIFCYFLLIYLLTIVLVQFSLKSVSLNVLCYKSITSYLLDWYAFMGPLLIYEWQLPLLVKRVACMFCMKMIRNIASSIRLCSVIFRAWIFSCFAWFWNSWLFVAPQTCEMNVPRSFE